jgi:uncharacterized protein YndB with AHSA1/START domain
MSTYTVDIKAPATEVWQALTDPDLIERYMLGSKVTSDWEVGSPITWEGEWQGKTYRDKGEVLAVEPPRLLQVTHFSPLSGVEDKPENYHTVTYELSDESDHTRLELTQEPGEGAEWDAILSGLKELVESG